MMPMQSELQAVALFAAQLEDPATQQEAAWSWNDALYVHHVINPDYDIDAARSWLQSAAADSDFVASADLGKVRAMMTFLSRAERFCDGWIEEYANNGVIALLCRRMGELAAD